MSPFFFRVYAFHYMWVFTRHAAMAEQLYTGEWGMIGGQQFLTFVDSPDPPPPTYTPQPLQGCRVKKFKKPNLAFLKLLMTNLYLSKFLIFVDSSNPAQGCQVQKNKFKRPDFLQKIVKITRFIAWIFLNIVSFERFSHSTP